MRYVCALLLILLLAGCRADVPPSRGVGAGPTPSADEEAPLKPFAATTLGLTLAYPEHFEPPEEEAGGGLRLRFDTGDLTIHKGEHPEGQSLAATVDQFVAASTEAANGRFAVVA